MDERIKGSDSFIFTKGVNNGPTANPIPKKTPYREILRPRFSFGDAVVIHVCVAKWRE